MKRPPERILVPVGAIRTCVFCTEQKPVVAVDRAENGQPEFVCIDCHRELQREIAASVRRRRR